MISYDFKSSYLNIRCIKSNFWKLANQTILERLLYGDGLLPQVDPLDDPLEKAQPSTVQADPTTNPVPTHGYTMVKSSENVNSINYRHCLDNHCHHHRTAHDHQPQHLRNH